jgi:putative ABC transport system permease protein
VLRTTLRSLWEHKRRLISTTVAVLLGVAFMSGTLVLGDTLDSSFDSLFSDINDEVDAEVRGPELFDTGFGLIRGPLDASVVDTVADVDGVAAATGNIASSGGRILGADGEPIGATNGPPTLLANWVEDPGLSGVELSEGRGPESDDELALNVGAAEDGELAVGDTVDVASAEGRQSYTLVGTFTIAGRDSAGGTVFGAFTTATAQGLAGLPDQFQTVTARTDDDITQEELIARIAPAIPEGTEVVTGEVAGQEMADAISGGLSFFTTFLMIFAVIALAVGAFIIYNTFSILVAQRGRELALMRAIGASRGQVLMSVLVEAALVGLIAAVLGIGAGILLAIGVQALLGAFGLDLPTEGLAVSPSTIVIALVAGLAVTFFSAVVPAWRATKVPPIAALRDVAQDTSGTSKIRLAIGLVLVVLAVLCLAPAFGEDPSTDTLQLVGLGGLILLVALIVLGPIVARPLSLALGWPISRLKGTTGQLAQQNAARSPKRTASTAAALMIGVALVAFISIFAASASSPTRSTWGSRCRSPTTCGHSTASPRSPPNARDQDRSPSRTETPRRPSSGRSNPSSTASSSTSPWTTAR